MGARGGGSDRDAKLLGGASGRRKRGNEERRGEASSGKRKYKNSVGISHENERGKGFSVRFFFSIKALAFTTESHKGPLLLLITFLRM